MSENAQRVEEFIQAIKNLRRDIYYLNEEEFTSEQAEVFETMLDLSYDFEKSCRDFIVAD